VLYEQAVQELAAAVDGSDGIKRRGIVLASLMRLKQICNHPSQWTGDTGYEADDSGKFARLREICEELAERQEKALVFTQFREITAPLADFLAGIFGRPGLVLHGEIAVGKRRELVEAFQRDDGPPFFVLSLKAGGTGLNLTAASHVIHFDRWWNPAVENQATDRAFRIGQKRNVLVHKFICRGTVEEKIDELIAQKTSLARDLLDGGPEALLTEMSNAELLRFVALDIGKATEK
jgi:non-specific serine/threonine protein kinase